MAGVAETLPVLAQRAASDGPRWTRAVGSISATPLGKGSLAVALLNGLFEHPAKIFFLWSIVREGFPHLCDGLGIEAGCRQFVVRSGGDVCQAAILFE